MLWEVEIQANGRDPERERVCAEFDLLADWQLGAKLIQRSARGYLLEGELEREQAQRLIDELLADPLVETAHLRSLLEAAPGWPHESRTVLLKPGVMDPLAQSVLAAANDLDI